MSSCNQLVLSPQALCSHKTSSAENLSGWKKTAYAIALLAPKLLLSGAGWAIGFAFGGFLGAGIGDAIGTYLGCVVSLGVELTIRKWGIQETLGKEVIQKIVKSRLKDAFVLSAGSFVGGMIFAPAMKWTASLNTIRDAHITQSLAVGAITAGAFVLGMTLARCTATFLQDKERSLSWERFQKDLKLAQWIIFPAEAAFMATSVALLGIKTLISRSSESIAKQALKAGAAVAIGGTAGALSQRVSSFTNSSR